MEGRCGLPTQSGAPCKNRGTPCRLHQTEDQCSICFLNMTRPRTLECGHSYHTRCIENWKLTCSGDPTCPICRTPFDVPVFKVTLRIERVIDQANTVQEISISNVTALVERLGIDLRHHNMMDIQINIENDQDIHEVLEILGIVHFNLPPI